MNTSVEVSPGIENIRIEGTEENEFGDILIRVSSLTEGACAVNAENRQHIHTATEEKCISVI